MNSRNNQVLLGIIILLLGVFSLAQSFLNINYGAISLMVIGFALIMLYKTKRKSWSLIVGVYLVYFGIISFLNMFGLESVTSILTGSVFFLVPGTIFMILFFDKGKEGLLIPASLLLWFGVYVFIGSFDFNNLAFPGLFFACMSMAFFTIYFLGKNIKRKWAFYLGFILLGIGAFRIMGFLSNTAFVGSVGRFLPALLIILGLIIIFKKTKKQQ
jgi:hypothetical protein